MLLGSFRNGFLGRDGQVGSRVLEEDLGGVSTSVCGGGLSGVRCCWARGLYQRVQRLTRFLQCDYVCGDVILNPVWVGRNFLTELACCLFLCLGCSLLSFSVRITVSLSKIRTDLGNILNANF